MTPKDLVDELMHDIYRAEESGLDWKFLDEGTKLRMKATALYLVLEGWSK